MRQMDFVRGDFLVRKLPPTTAAAASKQFIHEGWTLDFLDKDGRVLATYAHSDGKKHMTFKSLDSVVKRLRSLGFTGELIVYV